MADNKTSETDKSVDAFIQDVENQTRRKDAIKSLSLIKEITNLEAKMWGPSIVGFGKYKYHYKSGRQGEYFRLGFSPRKTSMTYYIMAQVPELETLRTKLGKHKMTTSCLYINKLADIDLSVLTEILQKSYEAINKKYPLDA